MRKLRIIARLDVKNEFVIKGIHLEGLRKIGDPNELARRYYQEGIDEINFGRTCGDAAQTGYAIAGDVQAMFDPIFEQTGKRTDVVRIPVNQKYVTHDDL